MVRFEKALLLAKSLGDRIKERRAVRGLAASSRMSNQSKVAIMHLQRVLDISREINDHVGDADAYGTIAGGCPARGAAGPGGGWRRQL